MFAFSLADGGVDEGHAWVTADGEKLFRGHVDEHPVPIERETGFFEPSRVDFDSPA